MRRGAAFLLGLLLVGTGRPTAALVCGEPSRLRHVSPWVGPAERAGPLWFVTGAVGPRAVVKLQPDYPAIVYPTKVLIYVRRRLRAGVSLQGQRCSDGKPLHFWYRRYPDNIPSCTWCSPEELEQIGDSVATLAPGRPPITSPALGYPGYMLFSGPGDWEVSVLRGGRVLGAAIIRTVP